MSNHSCMHLSSSSSCVRSSIWTCAEIKRATLVDPQVLVLQCRHTRRSRGRKEKASANKNGSRADIPSLSSGRPTNALWAWLVGRTWENRAREMQPGLCLDACTARSLNPRKNARTERFRGARLSFSSYLLSLTRPYRRVHGRRKTLGFRFPLSRDPSPGISHLPPAAAALLTIVGSHRYSSPLPPHSSRPCLPPSSQSLSPSRPSSSGKWFRSLPLLGLRLLP